MKTLKLIIGILLLIGGLGSLFGLFNSISSYDSAETMGHLFVLLVIFGIAYWLLKPKKK